MNESAPAPVLPPVPWWERVAAGVLVAGWVVWFYIVPEVRWRESIANSATGLHFNWITLLEQPKAHLFSPLDSRPVIAGVVQGLWLVLDVSLPFLIVGGLVISSGRCGRFCRWLWWLALSHGVLFVVLHIFAGRMNIIDMIPFAKASDEGLPWHRGWLLFFENRVWRALLPGYWPYLAELPLAALVLWFTRKQRQKPNAADSTAQA